MLVVDQSVALAVRANKGCEGGPVGLLPAFRNTIIFNWQGDSGAYAEEQELQIHGSLDRGLDNRRLQVNDYLPDMAEISGSMQDDSRP